MKIKKNEFFPCDMIMLNSSGPKGICYIETKNLDGETNLKSKTTHKDLNKLCDNEKKVINMSGTVECSYSND